MNLVIPLTKNVYLIPDLLDINQTQGLLNDVATPMFACGPGGDEHGHYSEPEPEPKKKKKPKKKPHKLPKIAEIFANHLGLKVNNVDDNMKIFKLSQGINSAVAPHRDEDFIVDGMLSSWSLLVGLNSEYIGGETIFYRNVLAPKLLIGFGLLFHHSVLHEGYKVLSGTKCILKTDLIGI